MRLFRGLMIVSIALSFIPLAHDLEARILAIYPPEPGGADTEDSFEYQLLKLALEKSGRDFELRTYGREISENRQRAMLKAGEEKLTVAWYGTSREFESELRPVRIPIFKGLLGFRLFLIHKELQPKFSTVRTLADLRLYTAIQGDGWSDIEILSSNSLAVTTGQYRNIFSMIDRKRADYFPRGAHEAFIELADHGPLLPNLKIEDDLVLVYPFAMFYFTSRENHDLHDAIYDGLAMAHEDGSYDAMLVSHPSIRAVLEQARLSERHRIDIDNPLLSEETRKIKRKFWFDPIKFREE